MALLCLDETKGRGSPRVAGYLPSEGWFQGLIIERIYACCGGEEGEEEGRPVRPLGLYPQM